MSSVKFLKDGNNEDFYPVTHESAVIDNNGKALSSKIAEVVFIGDKVSDSNFELEANLASRVAALETNAGNQAEIIEIKDKKQNKTDNRLQTNSKDIVGAINELFQDVDNGKQLIASAIDDGIVTANSSFSAMSNAIRDMKANYVNNLESVKASLINAANSILDEL